MSNVFDAKTSTSLFVGIQDLKNEQAWREFYQRYEPMIRAWCRQQGLFGDDNDEVTADVLLALAKSMPAFCYDPTQGFRKWLKTVVCHKTWDLWRLRRREPDARGTGDSGVRSQLEQQPETWDNLSEQLNAPLEQRRQWLHQAMNTVQDRYRVADSNSWEAFRLGFLEGQPRQKVADQLGMTYGAVCSAIYRIKQAIDKEASRLENPT